MYFLARALIVLGLVVCLHVGVVAVGPAMSDGRPGAVSAGASGAGAVAAEPSGSLAGDMVFVGRRIRTWPGDRIRFHESIPAKWDWSLGRAVRAWNAAGGNIRFVEVSRRGRAQLTIDYGRTGSAQAKATVGRTDNARIRLSERYRDIDAGPARWRVWVGRLFAHELGHVLGFRHTTRQCSLMKAVTDLAACPLLSADRGYYRCRWLDKRLLAKFVRRYGGTAALAPRKCPIGPLPAQLKRVRFSGGQDAGRPVRITWDPPRRRSRARVEVRLWRTRTCGAPPSSAPYFHAAVGQGRWRDPGYGKGRYCYRARVVNRYGAGRPPFSAVRKRWTPAAGLPIVADVSANGRYFVDQYGRPILVKGDSPWAILVNSSRASMDDYLETRAAQGFNVVLVSLLGNVANGGPSNNGATYDGVRPFVGGDPAALNDVYWDRVSHFTTKAASLGITVMAYPIDGWVGTATYDGLAAGWSTAQAESYGGAVAARFAGHPNVLWAVGGDFPNTNGGSDDSRMWSVLTGISDAGADRPRTIQFTLDSTSLDSTFWDEKVDFDFVYSYSITYAMVGPAYTATNPSGAHVPALMSETHYEAYDGVTNRYLRSQAAWALTSGSPGEFYGSEEIWDADPTRAAMNTAAVHQLSAMRAAFESLDGWQRLVPDLGSSFITAGRGTKLGLGEYFSGNTYVTGGRTADGRLAVIYHPAASRTITVDTSQLVDGYTARWVDPTNGSSTSADPGTTFTKAGTNAAGDSDWLLVLEAPAPAAARLPAPGRRLDHLP